MDGWMGGWMGGWTDGRVDGWMDGWTDRWVDGRIDGSMNDGTACMRVWMRCTFMQVPGSFGSGSPELYTAQILLRVWLLRLMPWNIVPIAPRNLQTIRAQAAAA